jgi:tetratricopeptide (TPR) repeat protein
VDYAKSQVNGHNAYYYFYKGNIASMVIPGRYNTTRAKTAIAFYSKAIKVNPYFSEAYRNRGRIYRDLNMNTNALADFTKAIKFASSNVGLYFDRGKTYYKLMDYDKAINDFKISLSVFDRPDECFWIAKAELKLGMKTQARDYYLKAVTQRPQNGTDSTYVDLRHALGIK